MKIRGPGSKGVRNFKAEEQQSRCGALRVLRAWAQGGGGGGQGCGSVWGRPGQDSHGEHVWGTELLGVDMTLSSCKVGFGHPLAPGTGDRRSCLRSLRPTSGMHRKWFGFPRQ